MTSGCHPIRSLANALRMEFDKLEFVDPFDILELVALARERPRLPLMRELSAKLTEGEIFNNQIYIFAYTAKITVNIQIADSDYC